jgi:hypothetical protein
MNMRMSLIAFNFVEGTPRQFRPFAFLFSILAERFVRWVAARQNCGRM